MASFLRALGKNGRVLWVQLLPADPDAGPEAGNAIVERRLVTTGRVSRETGEWLREEPFVPCAVRDGDGWTHVRVRLDPEKGLGNLPFNLGVARSYYKWVVVGADALSGAELELAESLWPLRVALCSADDASRKSAKGAALRLVCDPSLAESRWKGETEHLAPTVEAQAAAFRQWFETRFLRRHPASLAVRASRRALVPLALFLFLSALLRPWFLPGEQRRMHEEAEPPRRTIAVEAGSLPEARRAARWALFRFNRRFPSEQAILSLLDSALAGAGMKRDGDDWKRLPGAAPDTSGDRRARLVFAHSAVDPRLGAYSERERQAYEFYSSLLLDSMAYPTDHWWPRADRAHRRHDGVDVAAAAGTSIVSPISGRAFTGEGDRGGVSIGVRNSKLAVLMAHCDKRLFLDGDSVHAGDAVATVGMTGRTSGPHLHLMTGVVSPTGTGNAGGTRVRWMDPVEWYHSAEEELRRR